MNYRFCKIVFICIHKSKSKKVFLRNLDMPSSMFLRETESGESCLALEIKDSCSELRSPNVTLCVAEAETTLEYETK